MLLITGCNGQLGHCLADLLTDAICTDVKTLDITNADEVNKFVKDNNIDLIINCAAYTAVDMAQNDSLNTKKINVDGPKNLAKTGAKIIHISTDYVFDGCGHLPYTPDMQTNPLSVYGQTKRDGEIAVAENSDNYVIIRTAWLYSEYGNNFVKTMRRLGTERDSINVVSDQIGTPTFARNLADAIVKIIPQMSPEKSGIYHYTNMGVCSWYDFASEIMEISGLKCNVNPIKSEQYPTPAPRPFYSVLDKTKIIDAFGIEIPHWKKGLKQCINELNKN